MKVEILNAAEHPNLQVQNADASMLHVALCWVVVSVVVTMLVFSRQPKFVVATRMKKRN
jgi:hypothetical protein